MSADRVLITGGGGQLASDLEASSGRGGAEVLAPSRADLDITDDAAVARGVRRGCAPTLVFNCAAFHNVEVCEREEDQRVRGQRARRQAARRALRRGRARGSCTSAPTTCSTARPRSPTTRTTLPNPRSIYAISKLAGEHAALAYAPDALVVRTAGLYGLHGSVSKGGNFVTRMIARAREQGALKVVADQRLTPTFTARPRRRHRSPPSTPAPPALLHLTNAGETSWHGFTEAIMRARRRRRAASSRPTTVRAPGAADRPLNGVLRSDRGPRSPAAVGGRPRRLPRARRPAGRRACVTDSANDWKVLT